MASSQHKEDPKHSCKALNSLQTGREEERNPKELSAMSALSTWSGFRAWGLSCMNAQHYSGGLLSQRQHLCTAVRP